MLTTAPPRPCFEWILSDRRMMPATVLPYSGSPPAQEGAAMFCRAASSGGVNGLPLACCHILQRHEPTL
jgi:hypothetical protein